MNLRQRTSRYSYNSDPDKVIEIVKQDLARAVGDLDNALDAAKELSDLFANDSKAPSVLALTEARNLAQVALERTQQIVKELE